MTGERSRPAACRTCCRAVVRSPTPAPAWTSAAAWGTTVPARPGRDGDAIVAAAAAGELAGLVVGGVDLDDLADPRAGRAALAAARFVVSLEIRASEVTEHADVVFPVAPVAEKAGTFVDWEGRLRPFDNVFRQTNALPDLRVLSGIAEELGVVLGFRTVAEARAQMGEVGPWDGERAAAPTVLPEPLAAPERGEARLVTWKLLLDDGRMLDGEAELKATGRRPTALVSATTLADLGLSVGERVRLTGTVGSVELPVAVADLPDGVVWAPASSGGVNLARDAGATSGSVVRVGGAA